MSVEARVPHSTPAGGGGPGPGGGGGGGGGGGVGRRRRTTSQSSDDDRRQNSTEHESRNTAAGRVIRPQMTSQNGVITIGPNSDIPRCVDLRRAQSLRDTEGEPRVRRERVQNKRHTVIFDLPDKKDDIASDVSNQNGRQGPKKPPRPRLQGHIEEEPGALKKGQQKEEEGEKKDDDDTDGQGSPGFNTVTLRRSLASGIARVRSFSGGKEVELARYNVEKRSSRGNNARGPYVQYKDTEGDWKRHSVRRASQYEPCDHTFKVMLIGDSCVGKTCILTRFKDGTFLSGTFISTVGIDFRAQSFLDPKVTSEHVNTFTLSHLTEDD